MGRRDEPFGSGVRWQAGGRKRHRRVLPAGQSLLPTTLQLKDSGQPAQGDSQTQRIALSAAPISYFAPSRNGLGQVARELGVATETFEYVQSSLLVVSIRPKLQGPAGGPLGISISVDGTGCIGRPQQRCPRLLRPPAKYPVFGNQHRGSVQSAMPLGHRLVQRNAPSPGNLAIEGIAYQCMTKRHASRIGPDNNAAAHDLVRPLG